VGAAEPTEPIPNPNGRAAGQRSGEPEQEGSVIQQDNKLTSAANFSGADSVTAPDFWPKARLRSQIALGYVPDPGYTKDAPKPFVTRTIRGTRRLIGALQAAP